MKRSTDRILTTHTGSLPRTAKVVELLLAEQNKPGARKAELNAAVREAIAHVVQKQIECGIDIIGDGEQGRTDYTVHVLDRLTGFAGESTPPLGTGDEEFPELAQLLTHFASPFQYRPSCTREATWKNWAAALADIDMSKDAMKGANAAELFMTSPSPGQIARYLKNKHYETEQAYVYALADVMKREYKAIVDAGFILQLDCPDLAMLRHTVYLDRSLSDFRDIIAVNVAALIRQLQMDRISVDELRALIDDGQKLLILDVRPKEARMQHGFIPGAVPAHPEDIDPVVTTYSRELEIIVYCACPNEASAAVAAKHLNA